MAFSSLDDLVSALPGQIEPFTKASVTSVAGAYASLWAVAGQPGAGSLSIGNTTTGVIPTDATAGAFSFSNNAGGSEITAIARFSAASSVMGTVVLYDRVWHAGSFTSVNGSISITNPTTIPDRTYGPAANVYQATELWAEIATTLSATATTITVTYVDGLGNTGLTAPVTLPSSGISPRMFPFAMANRNGIQKINSMTGTAAPTGTFNLVMLTRLVECPISIVGVAQALDFAGVGFSTVKNDACLSLFMNTNTTSSGTLSGTFNLAIK